MISPVFPSRLRFAAILLAGWLLSAWAIAQGIPEQRLALVIGNAAYKTSPLTNPVNDARLMEASLKEAGFTVIKAENASMRDMRRLVRDFGDRLKASGGVGLFYFAGHGVQVRGENFLVSTDSDIRNEDEVADDAINANLILEKMQSAGNRMNLVILDACRNNPFTVKSRAAVSGLATMSAPSGSLVAFSTSPGSVASDGNGQNGLHTEHLAKVIRQPGLPVEEVFKQVRTAVRRDSNNQQTPWENTALEGQFYFKMPAQTAPAATQGRANPINVPPAEMALWSSVTDSLTASEVQAYLNRYPSGLFADVAKARIAALLGSTADKAASQRIASERAANERAAAEASLRAAEAAIEQNKQLIAARTDPVTLDMAFWENVKGAQRPAELEAYIQQFPKGMFIALAKVRVEDMRARPTPVIAAKAPSLADATPLAMQASPGEVLGNLVIRDEFSKKTETIEVRVKDKTALQTSFSSGDVLANDGQVLSVRLGGLVVTAKSASLWKMPLQTGSSGEAKVEITSPFVAKGSLEWKVISTNADRQVVDVKMYYTFTGGSFASQQFVKWLGSYAAGQGLPSSFSYSNRQTSGPGGLAGTETLSAEFTPKK